MQWKWEWRAGEEGEEGTWVKRPGADGGKQSEDNWVWSPQGVVNMHCPERWGWLTFLGDDAGSGVEAAGRAAGAGEAQQERLAREALMAWHYLLQDWMAAHEQQLPADLGVLEAQEVLALPAGTEYGITSRPDLPGGYLAFVRLSPRSRLCVRGDSLIWTDSS